jgi:predicted MFS family arabinose efflux permease
MKLFTLYRTAYGGLSRSVWLLALVMLINRSGTMVVPFLSVYLTHELGFSVARAGLVMAGFGLGAVTGAVVGGRLTDRFGYLPVMTGSLALGGLMFLVVGQMRTFPALCGTIFLLSVVGEAFRPALSASVATYATRETMTRSYSLIRLASNLGFSVGPAVGGVLAGFGYQWLFACDGGTNLLAATGLVLFLGKTHQPSARPTAETEAPSGGGTSAWRDGYYLLFSLFGLLFAVSFCQLFTMMPVFLKQEYRFPEPRIGLWLALNAFLVATVEMLLIHTVEPRGSRLGWIRLGVALTGLAFVALNLLPGWTPVVWLAVLLLTFGEMFAMPFMQSFSVTRAAPEARGQYAAVYSVLWSSAQVLAPTLGGQIAQWAGFTALWWLMAAFGGASWLGFGWLKRRSLRFEV